ncbi:MAG: AAA family ATPase [Rhizobiaceae bacterium]
MSGKETFVPLSSIKARKVEWFWEPLIPFGMITIMEGDPGEGKSFLAMHLAAIAMMQSGIWSSVLQTCSGCCITN